MLIIFINIIANKTILDNVLYFNQILILKLVFDKFVTIKK